MNPRPRLLLLIAALVLPALISACQGTVQAYPELPAADTAYGKPSPSPVVDLPTSGVSLPSPQATPSIETPPAVTALPAQGNSDLLKYVFPSQGPMPVSAWRPPLYEAPWALSPYDHFYFARPIPVNEVNWPLADYRYGGIFPGTENVIHTGVDIDAPNGTEVIAAAAGTVIWAGYGLYSGTANPDDPYGLAVTIRHNFGYQGRSLYTVYAHMQEILVVRGQKVETGDTLGLVGETGFTTGPHLHFEIRMDENDFFTTRNPELWMVPPQGWGVLAGRITDRNDRPQHRLEVLVRSKETGQFWTVITYGSELVSRDPYYRENMVLSDLPEGDYTVQLEYLSATYKQTIHIKPGMVNYFTFKGFMGFSTNPPPDPARDFSIDGTPTPVNK